MSMVNRQYGAIRAESPTGSPTLERTRNPSPERAWATGCCRRPYRAYSFLCPFRRALPYAVAFAPFGLVLRQRNVIKAVSLAHSRVNFRTLEL